MEYLLPYYQVFCQLTGRRRKPAKTLCGDVEGAVKLAGHILKNDQTRKFDNAVVFKELPQSRH